MSDRRAEVVFRVDSGTAIGSGHAARCMTLARELRRRRARVRFICRELPGNLISRIEADDYEVWRLPAALTEEEDARRSCSLVEQSGSDWLVLDHYGIGEQWESIVRTGVGRVLVIEDLDSRRHRCDVLLDQNWYGDATSARHEDQVDKGCQRLLGPRFALLHGDYARLRDELRDRSASEQRILVFFGGTDSTDETGKVLEALSSRSFAGVEVDVVVGSNHPNRNAILERIKVRPGTQLHENLPSLAGLMVRADLALGAGGTTTWERLCLDLPSLVTTLADNQETIIAPLARAGYVHWTGRSVDTTPESYRRALREHALEIGRLEPLVDGFGSRRVGEILLPSEESPSLRPAKTRDSMQLFSWRNDPTVRAMSFSEDVVSWDTHLEWFRRKLDDEDTRIFILEADGLPVGQARLDFHPGEAVLSFSLDRIVRGRGWGGWMISEALRRTKRHGSTRVRAHVKPENQASLRIFAKLGWTQISSSIGEIVFQAP